MTASDRVLRRIDRVLEMEQTPADAYPLRARLGRAVFEVTRWVRNEAPFGVSEADIRELISVADHIMQPSEPFDARWRSEWHVATNHLRRLRKTLMEATAP